MDQDFYSVAGQYMDHPQPEKVDKAALQFRGSTYTGMNHGYALGDLMDQHGSDIPMQDVKDGFTTTKGRFVSREEAMDIAKAQDQIDQKYSSAIGESDSSMLLSEDLSHLQPGFYP